MSEPAAVRPPLLLIVTRNHASTAERVFDAWLDPMIAPQFLFATPGGRMIQVEIDAGRRRGADRRAAGVWRRAPPPAVRGDRTAAPAGLLFAAGMDREADADWSRVTIDIAARQGGGCTLTLRHDMDPALAEWADRTRAGWSTMLDSLEPLTGDA